MQSRNLTNCLNCAGTGEKFNPDIEDFAAPIEVCEHCKGKGVREVKEEDYAS